jgi:GH25 family lysozyme M1 (1,4-beta-N-acetylmuramidase)
MVRYQWFKETADCNTNGKKARKHTNNNQQTNRHAMKPRIDMENPVEWLHGARSTKVPVTKSKNNKKNTTTKKKHKNTNRDLIIDGTQTMRGM